ncbi:MAG: hypothetical protein ABIT05_05745 [Chitinophagaceae bacterium]
MRTYVPYVRLIVLICLFSSISPQSFSQSLTLGNGKIEAGLGIGPSFFLGDLGGAPGKGKTFIKDVDLPTTKIMKGIYVNYYPAEWLGLRVAANMGQLQGNDSLTNNKGGHERFRKQRNLQFKSKIAEAYAALELYPTVFLEQYDGLQGKLRPYGLAGFGVFHFNPQGEYIRPDGTKEWVDLKPLRLEGEGMTEYPDRKEYSLIQMEMVMGGGIKYYIKENMYVGFEILHRKTFTDYVDDVSTQYVNPALFSTYLTPEQATMARQLMYRENLYNPSVSRPYINTQRGDPKENDAFFSALLRFGWRLNGDNSPNARARKQLKCPVFY